MEPMMKAAAMSSSVSITVVGQKLRVAFFRLRCVNHTICCTYLHQHMHACVYAVKGEHRGVLVRSRMQLGLNPRPTGPPLDPRPTGPPLDLPAHEVKEACQRRALGDAVESHHLAAVAAHTLDVAVAWQQLALNRGEATEAAGDEEMP